MPHLDDVAVDEAPLVVELVEGRDLDGTARLVHDAYFVAPTRTGKFSVSSRYGVGT